MSYLTAENLVSGQEGRAYVKIDGQNRELLYLKEVTATVTKKKTAVRTLGRRGDQFKSSGFSGSGKYEQKGGDRRFVEGTVCEYVGHRITNSYANQRVLEGYLYGHDEGVDDFRFLEEGCHIGKSEVPLRVSKRVKGNQHLLSAETSTYAMA